MPNDEEPLTNGLCYRIRCLVALDDVGGGEFQAAVLLDPDGEETYALLSASALKVNVPFGAAVVPSHESMDTLPSEHPRPIEVVKSGKLRLDGMQYCGRLTLSNLPCRNKAAGVFGWGCHLHRFEPLPGQG